MIIRNHPMAPRRGNKHTAQGNALGTNGDSNSRPERANLGAARAKELAHFAESRQDKTKSKALLSRAFALSGRGMKCVQIYPGRQPGL